MTMELKCCPFCGGASESDSERGYRNMTTGNLESAAAIYCTSCNADMTWCYRDTPEIERDQVMTLLTEQWNTRALSQLTASPDREKVAACARKCADDLVQIIETATKVAKRTGNTFVIDRQKVATMISGHLSTIAPDEAAIRADEREKCARIADAKSDAVMAEAEAAHEDKNYNLYGRLECQAGDYADLAAAIRSQEAGR